MPVNGTVVLVRNDAAGPTIFSDRTSGDHVEWEGAGDENGGDVQIVPESFFSNPNFIRAIQRGILSLENAEDNPDLAASLEKHLATESQRKQRSAAIARRESMEHAGNEDIEYTPDNDLVAVKCPQPTRGGKPCGDEVLLKSAKLNSTPPLCPKHSSHAPEYVPEESWVDHKRVVEWKRMTIGPRERENR